MILNYKIASRYKNEDDELTASDDSITDLPEGLGKDE